MVGLRRIIGCLTALCLVCHLALPIAALTVSSTLTSECTCPHAAKAGTCPMHKTAAGATQCRLRRADDSASLALVALSGILGLTPASTPASRPGLAARRLFTTLVTPLDRPVLPDLPPPRV